MFSTGVGASTEVCVPDPFPQKILDISFKVPNGEAPLMGSRGRKK
jgi:hypothetical protein